MSVDQDHVRWHDIECGAYNRDLDLWTELANREQGPILEVGAGTGRVSLHLARAGHPMSALDSDAVFLSALKARADSNNLPVKTIVADAADFVVDNTKFGTIIVPMSTIQLIHESAMRQSFFSQAMQHLITGGLVVVAITENLVTFDPHDSFLPIAESAIFDDIRYVSQPIGVRSVPNGFSIERVRQIITPDGQTRHEEFDSTVIARVSANEIISEASSAGFSLERTHVIPQTHDHVESKAVFLRGQ